MGVRGWLVEKGGGGWCGERRGGALARAGRAGSPAAAPPSRWWLPAGTAPTHRTRRSGIRAPPRPRRSLEWSPPSSSGRACRSARGCRRWTGTWQSSSARSPRATRPRGTGADLRCRRSRSGSRRLRRQRRIPALRTGRRRRSTGCQAHRPGPSRRKRRGAWSSSALPPAPTARGGARAA